jgi:hypothetical protein
MKNRSDAARFDSLPAFILLLSGKPRHGRALGSPLLRIVKIFRLAQLQGNGKKSLIGLKGKRIARATDNLISIISSARLPLAPKSSTGTNALKLKEKKNFERLFTRRSPGFSAAPASRTKPQTPNRQKPTVREKQKNSIDLRS